MKSNEVFDRYKELCECDKFVCTQEELQSFKLYGLVIETGKNQYMLRNSNITKITVLKDLNHNFNLDFRALLNIDLKEYDTNKVYYMSKDTYNKYKELNLIITHKNNEYYRLYSGEIWLVKFL